MILLLEWLSGLIVYVGLGIGMARSQAKRIFRQARKRHPSAPVQAKDMYHGSLAGWVFFWPLRILSAVLKFILEHVLIRPAEATASWCSDLVKAPVNAILKAADETEKEVEEWSTKLKDPEATEFEKEFAEEMRDAAYKRQRAAYEDLGMEPPQRRAIASPEVNETVRRGMATAQTVLRDMRFPKNY